MIKHFKSYQRIMIQVASNFFENFLISLSQISVLYHKKHVDEFIQDCFSLINNFEFKN